MKTSLPLPCQHPAVLQCLSRSHLLHSLFTLTNSQTSPSFLQLPDHSWNRLPLLDPTDSSHRSLTQIHAQISWDYLVTAWLYAAFQPPVPRKERKRPAVWAVWPQKGLVIGLCLSRKHIFSESTVQRPFEHNQLKENIKNTLRRIDMAVIHKLGVAQWLAIKEMWSSTDITQSHVSSCSSHCTHKGNVSYCTIKEVLNG